MEFERILFLCYRTKIIIKSVILNYLVVRMVALQEDSYLADKLDLEVAAHIRSDHAVVVVDILDMAELIVVQAVVVDLELVLEQVAVSKKRDKKKFFDIILYAN